MNQHGQKTEEQAFLWTRYKLMFSNLSAWALLLIILGCGIATTRPKLEMSMAGAAYIAAKNVKASTLSPNLFRKAETFYLKAKSAYRRKYFNKAKQYAILSQQYSEKAEYKSIKKATLKTPEEFE